MNYKGNFLGKFCFYNYPVVITKSDNNNINNNNNIYSHMYFRRIVNYGEIQKYTLLIIIIKTIPIILEPHGNTYIVTIHICY